MELFLFFILSRMSFLTFFTSKTISNKQALAIGFVLGLLSMLTLAAILVLMPLFGAWLNYNGVIELDFIFTAFIFIFICSTQALILFGFPLYYAQDRKSHMTGFRILLFTLMWMLILMGLTGLFFVQMHSSAEESYSLDAFEAEMQEMVPSEEMPVQALPLE
jgi:hypothetical protein